MAGFLKDDVRADVDHWLRLHQDMYIAAAGEMGFELSAQTVGVIFTFLDGARRWADWNGSDRELARLGERAVVLTRSILARNSGIRSSAETRRHPADVETHGGGQL